MVPPARPSPPFSSSTSQETSHGAMRSASQSIISADSSIHTFETEASFLNDA